MIEVVHPVTGYRLRVPEGKAEFWEGRGYVKPAPPKPARKAKQPVGEKD